MTLAEGIGDNLPFSKLYASHCASIDAILKYGTKTQKEITCLDSVAGIFTPFSLESGLKMNEEQHINGKINIQGRGRHKVGQGSPVYGQNSLVSWEQSGFRTGLSTD